MLSAGEYMSDWGIGCFTAEAAMLNEHDLRCPTAAALDDDDRMLSYEP